MNLADIKGFGEKRIKKLEAVGIFSPLDLIMCLPFKYVDLSAPVNINNICDGDEVSFLAAVDGEPVSKFVRKGLSFVKVKMKADDFVFGCTWFNQRFIAAKLKPGKVFYVSGKAKKFKNSLDISAPLLTDYKDDGKTVIPIYRKIKGLPANLLTEAIAEALKSVRVNSYLTRQLSESYKLMPLNDAFFALHNPKNMCEIEVAGRTIALENLSYTLCIFMLLKQKNANNRVFHYSEHQPELNKVINSLPFKLTDEQQKVVNEVVESLHGAGQMNRLLQGDVGSGKTIIAFLAMYYAYLSGFQSVLMAPTELLARQHYQNALKIFGNTDVKIELLTGSQTKRERDNSLFLIKSGMADFVIGTHALIEDSVCFSRLALTVTDEQHRFGVNQRGSLENKADGCDCLVMSATPIPRTLALTLYGDLQQSLLREMPRGRAGITTKFVPQRKVKDMLEYIYNKSKAGEQSYLVCPRIEDEEDGLTSVAELYVQLTKAYPDLKAEILHGQQKDCDKALVMSRFVSGEIAVLVTTTVVEVGIDVPKATSMVIFNAERYGLSQLHQLRGRVGRGEINSFCFVLSENESESTIKRLEYFCGCGSGFELAEYDFEQRGAGDFIGKKQHGESSGFNVKINASMIATAKEIAQILLAQPQVCASLTEGVGQNGCEYIKSLTLN